MDIFRIEFTISRTGNQILKFIQPISTINELAITNVALVGLELLTDCGAIYLPPLNFDQGKVFNIEDYEYQDKPVSLRTESVLPSRAMPLGVDRTAYLFFYYLFYGVSCMQCLVFWTLDFGYIPMGISVFFGN